MNKALEDLLLSEHPDNDISNMSLRKLKREITNWELEHIKKYGALTCGNPSCQSIYDYIREVYALRYRREKLGQPNVFYIDRGNVYSCWDNTQKVIKHTLFAMHKSAWVNEGDLIKIVEDRSRVMEYRVKYIDKINYNHFKAVVKIHDIKLLTN